MMLLTCIQTFEEKAEEVRQKTDVVNKLPDDKKLELYALFKQGSIGDNATDKPGMLDFKGKAKWEAWKEKSGISQEEAQQAYIELIEALFD